MVAYIRSFAVDRKHWLDSETFSSGVAFCQMIPGATAMQTAAYVGLRTRGILGAAAAFIGFGLPAFLLMLAFSALYAGNQNLPVVVSAFSGLQAIIVAILAYATFSFGKTTLKGWKRFIIAGIAALLFGFNVNPILVILLAAMMGFWLIQPGQPSADPASAIGQEETHIRPVLLILCATSIGVLLLFLLKPTLFDLFILMFRIDLTAFGGGFASVPLMFHEIVEVRNWMNGQTFMNGIILGQVTPGPIVITATFVGFLLDGVYGAIIATIGIFLPSFMLVVGISPYYNRFRSSPYFNKVIYGVLCSFVGLLLAVTIRFTLDVQWDIRHLVLGIAAFVALYLKVDILWVVVAGTIISVLLFL